MESYTSSVCPTPSPDPAAVEVAAKALAAAERVVVFTGAGMSAESGIPTFRDPEAGVWKNKVALALFGVPFGWRWMPSIAWWGYKRFHAPIAAAQPNAGHVAVAHLQAELDLRGVVAVITQNVDALHQRGGTVEGNVHELHGTVMRHRCIAAGHPMDVLGQGCSLPACQPRCRVCGSPARPDAVLFHEALPSEAWLQSVSATRALRAGDVLLVIGTSGVVYPAASLPGYCAAGVVKVELNRELTHQSEDMDVVVLGPSATTLPCILQRAKELKGSR